jgi:hypothetical protein
LIHHENPFGLSVHIRRRIVCRIGHTAASSP